MARLVWLVLALALVPAAARAQATWVGPPPPALTPQLLAGWRQALNNSLAQDAYSWTPGKYLDHGSLGPVRFDRATPTGYYAIAAPYYYNDGRKGSVAALVTKAGEVLCLTYEDSMDGACHRITPHKLAPDDLIEPAEDRAARAALARGADCSKCVVRDQVEVVIPDRACEEERAISRDPFPKSCPPSRSRLNRITNTQAFKVDVAFEYSTTETIKPGQSFTYSLGKVLSIKVHPPRGPAGF